MTRRSVPIEEKIEIQKDFEEVMRFLSGREVDDE